MIQMEAAREPKLMTMPIISQILAPVEHREVERGATTRAPG